MYQFIKKNIYKTIKKDSTYIFSLPPSKYTALSCFLFINPAILSLYLLKRKNECLMWCIITLSSYMSDIYYAGKYSNWHIMDRVSAKFGMFI